MTSTTKWEKWIDIGVNGWISVKENGDEYLNEKDIVNLKTSLSKTYRELLKDQQAKDIEKLRKKTYAYDENEDSGCIDWKDVLSTLKGEE